jgi:hypothetical protein
MPAIAVHWLPVALPVRRDIGHEHGETLSEIIRARTDELIAPAPFDRAIRGDIHLPVAADEQDHARNGLLGFKKNRADFLIT